MVSNCQKMLQADRERLILRIKKDNEIDMGAPRFYSEDLFNSHSHQKERIKSAPHGDHSEQNVDEEEESIVEDLVDLGSPLKGKRHHKAGKGRRPPRPYTPNPRLYRKEESGKWLKLPTTNSKQTVKGHVRQRSYESPIRRIRRKHTTRSLVPNPRLYQAPPNRPRVAQTPPLNPVLSWSPPSKLGPQETASQIALRLAQRTIIPFREFLPSAVQPGPVKKQLGRSKDPALREKTRTVKSRRKSQQVVSPRENKRSKSIVREELLPEKSLFEELVPENPQLHSPPPSAHYSILKISQTPPSLDAPFQSYADASPKPYIPRSRHFRQPLVKFESVSSSSTIQPIRPSSPPTLAEDPTMASTPQSSITPEDISEGNDSLSSAPSEYLAEFLSAIMSRKYADALKYCRLILHYEPQNATARSFYPILRNKLGYEENVKTNNQLEGKMLSSSNSESASGSSGALGRNATRTTGSPDGAEDSDETSGDSDSDAADYLASLSLDSSAKSSRCGSPAVCGTDSSEGSAEVAEMTPAQVKTATCWLADDNGNLSPLTRSNKTHHPDDDDVENDNAASGDHTLLLKDPTLRQLRAQYTCSIK